MKHILLKEIQITNFKGIKNLSIQLNQVTNIKGENAVGKTSIFDAFCWVLFGKDSHGNSKFNVRPIDKNGKDIDFIDISVNIVLSVDDKEISIKKTQSQKWTKPKGKIEQRFDGNENKYEWDEYPKSEKEHNALISEIVTETVFMIVTNPSFFPSLNWKDQRAALMQLVSNITDESIINSDNKFACIKSFLEEKTIDEVRAKYAKGLKELNKKIEAVPIRIDELSKAITEVDYSSEEKKLEQWKEDLSRVDAQLENDSKGYEVIRNLKEKIHSLKEKIQQLEFVEKDRISSETASLNSKISQLQLEFNSLMDETSTLNKQIAEKTEALEKDKEDVISLRKKFVVENEMVFDETSILCPVCGHSFPDSKIEEMKSNFIQNKNSNLSNIRNKGKAVNDNIAILELQINELKQRQTEVIAKKTEVFKEKNILVLSLQGKNQTVDLSCNTEYKALQEELKREEEQLSKVESSNCAENLKLEKEIILKRISDCDKIIGQKHIMDDLRNKVLELRAEEKQLVQQAADSEKILFILDEFIKTKISRISDSINSKFHLINWKLVKDFVNGGFEPCCECTLNGVPYTNLNSAGKVQAGLDIIETISDIYMVQAPIFIDNREGVNRIPDMDSQIINLIVTNDSEIKVEEEIACI